MTRPGRQRTFTPRLISGWTLTPSEVVADLKRILGNTQRVAIAGHTPEVAANASRNADTLQAAIQLLESRQPTASGRTT